MSSTFGKNIKISLFGESHNEAVGITILGLPAGIKLNTSKIQETLDLRKPGGHLSSPRKEPDKLNIISGVFNDFTTGTPLTIIIKNTNQKSSDYEGKQTKLRPSHADYVAYEKYSGFQDFRGGGHFSGRLTAPLVALGAICNQILLNKGITIGSYIKQIGNVKSTDSCQCQEILLELCNKHFPTLKPETQTLMEQEITKAKEANNSVGGIIESTITGVKVGYGEPFFDKLDSYLAHLLISIPAIKGIEFGKGFEFANLYGDEANDNFTTSNDKIVTTTNNSGGIQGGISNGMPITLRTVVKPTPSIKKPQQTIDYKSKQPISLEINGRHDPCIVPRVIHVQNALIAYGLLDLIITSEGIKWIK